MIHLHAYYLRRSSAIMPINWTEKFYFAQEIFFLGKNAHKCYAQKFMAARGSGDQKAFLLNRKMRNLLGSWLTEAFWAGSSEIIRSYYLHFEEFCADFAKEIEFLRSRNYAVWGRLVCTQNNFNHRIVI